MGCPDRASNCSFWSDKSNIPRQARRGAWKEVRRPLHYTFFTKCERINPVLRTYRYQLINEMLYIDLEKFYHIFIAKYRYLRRYHDTLYL